MTTLSAVGAARTILVLSGLLQLRRQLSGRAVWLVTLGAVFQALAVAQFVIGHVLVQPEAHLGAAWSAISPIASGIASVGLMLAVSLAAGAWRSALGPLAVLAAWLAEPPQFVARGLADVLGSSEAFDGCLAAAVVLHVITTLVVYRRLGTEVQHGPDAGRALRAARRAALALRVQAGLVVPFVALTIAGGSAFFYVALLANSLTAAGVVSGMLGVARSGVAGRPEWHSRRSALCGTWSSFTRQPGGGPTVRAATRGWSPRPSRAWPPEVLRCGATRAGPAISSAAE